MTTALQALEWMKSQKAAGQGDQFLFRGQNRVWPTIKPSITRLSPPTLGEMWTICRWFSSAAKGVTGYSIENVHDRLAILQHYVGRSPVIDLTGTPEIALYFALLGASDCECVVYSVNRECVKSAGVAFSNHSFLMLPAHSGGLKHRWIRQDGYSVSPACWNDLSVVTEFDLLMLDGVESKQFRVYRNDYDLVRDLGDLEDTASDPLAMAVRGAVTAIARSLGLLTPGITGILQASKTKDPDTELIEELEGMIALAANVNAPANLTQTLGSLRDAVGSTWDTGCDASLAWVRETFRGLVP